MGTLSDAEGRDLCRLPPVSSEGGDVELACTGTAGEAPEWELCLFPDRLHVAVGGETLDVRPGCETIDLGGPVAVRALGRFGLSLDVSEWLSGSTLPLDFLGSTFGGTRSDQ
jgi:hypothetical protein